MEDSKSSEEGKIKVVDRRKFSSDGERRSTDEVPEEEASMDADGADGVDEPQGPTGAGSAGFDHRPVEEPEGVDFTLLVNAMAQPVVMLLDEVSKSDPQDAQARLEQARLQIDLLGLLKVKCRGNLSSDEERLLDQVLYQLRMLFVRKQSAG